MAKMDLEFLQLTELSSAEAKDLEGGNLFQFIVEVANSIVSCGADFFDGMMEGGRAGYGASGTW